MRTSALIPLTFAITAAACAPEEKGLTRPYEADGDRITIQLAGGGSGYGTVKSRDITFAIGCKVRVGVVSNGTAGCRSTFMDTGGGGTIQLEALPEEGSRFTGWSGCTSVFGPICSLTFREGDGIVNFNVMARFSVD